MQNSVDEIVRAIAMKLEDYEQIEELETKPENIRYFEGVANKWEKCSLSHGLPGICLLYGKLMEFYPNEERWENAANRYLGLVVEQINQHGVKDISMFSGLSGIGLATASVSKKFKDYQKLISAINNGVLQTLPIFLQNVNSSKGTHSSLYDVISGLTGILSYLYLFKDDSECYNGLLEGLDALIELTQTIVINKEEVPGWYISEKNQFSQFENMLYSEGNFNTSMSHGIAGPLTLLSEMVSKGICRSNQKESIQRIVDFYFSYRLVKHNRDIWKGQIEFNEIKEKSPNTHNLVMRDAWCYGSFGICYALIRAGIALNDQMLIEYGIQNIRLTVPDIQGIFSPTFCHGYAGIYQVLNSIEALVKQHVFVEEKKVIKEKIMAFYEPDNLYGFHNIEYDYVKGELRPYESTGILEGAAGVCLSLFEGEHPGNSIWKRAFLLV
ncbi:MAG: lanthionine synthetase C family protein [Agathobacter sp.]|nr:lanthionine synthetase C family protein [Agathobacter sp.]